MRLYIDTFQIINVLCTIHCKNIDENIDVTLKRLRHTHFNNIIFSYLNINSIRNKFGDLDKIIYENIDILYIAETKLDGSFHNNQFVYQ